MKITNPNYKETRKQFVRRFLFVLILISSFSISGFGQTEESDEKPDVVPEQAMEQVVRRILVYSFKPRNKPTVIYLAERGIKRSWLPRIKNIKFRLLSIEEIQQEDLKVHFFTEPDLAENTYSVGFAFGNPTCEFLGVNWCFRISNQKVRLRECGGVYGFCSA